MPHEGQDGQVLGHAWQHKGILEDLGFGNSWIGKPDGFPWA